jgi:hypothetical protein
MSTPGENIIVLAIAEGFLKHLHGASTHRRSAVPGANRGETPLPQRYFPE